MKNRLYLGPIFSRINILPQSTHWEDRQFKAIFADINASLQKEGCSLSRGINRQRVFYIPDEFECPEGFEPILMQLYRSLGQSLYIEIKEYQSNSMDDKTGKVILSGPEDLMLVFGYALITLLAFHGRYWSYLHRYKPRRPSDEDFLVSLKSFVLCVSWYLAGVYEAEELKH